MYQFWLDLEWMRKDREISGVKIELHLVIMEGEKLQHVLVAQPDRQTNRNAGQRSKWCSRLRAFRLLAGLRDNNGEKINRVQVWKGNGKHNTYSNWPLRSALLITGVRMTSASNTKSFSESSLFVFRCRRWVSAAVAKIVGSIRCFLKRGLN